ncbi:MAG: hypothetical protein GTN76_14150 [Candidatus Aenigmarchaeota archaeon]|nr:hypothetical protein [Candidatus Aenigmarchaeota archaeon]
MIKNKFIAVILLIIMIAGAVLFTVLRSPWGPVITLIGIIGYFIFNRMD